MCEYILVLDNHVIATKNCDGGSEAKTYFWRKFPEEVLLGAIVYLRVGGQ